MKLPGPDHPITITPHQGRVRVLFAGRTVADTARALALREATYPPVFYIPRQDADFSLLVRSATTTTCPYKGLASYFSLRAANRSADDAVWSYEDPYAAVAAIRDCLAFYPNRVDAIVADPA